MKQVLNEKFAELLTKGEN